MPDRRSREILVLLSASSVLALGGNPAVEAASWSYVPTLSIGTDYDTNRALYLEPRGSGGALGTLQVRMDRSTETFSLDLTPQFDFQWFSDPILPRAYDFGVTGTSSWTGERSSLLASTHLTDQSLLYGERFDTGIVDVGTRRLGSEVDLSWTLAQTQRRSFSLQGSVQTADFTGPDVAGLENYVYESLAANEGFLGSERVEFDLGTNAGRFSSPLQSGASYSYAVDVGFKLKRTERLSVSGDIGVNELEYGSTNTKGLTFALSLAYATAVGSVNLTAQRAASPSGFGELTEQDLVQLSVSRSLSARLTLQPAVNFYRTSVAIGPVPIDTRTYAVANLTVAWRANEYWTLSAHVAADGARTEGLIDICGNVGTAHGFNGGLAATWSPVAHGLSR